MIATESSRSAENSKSYRFDFGPGKVARGYKQVLPSTLYTFELGYGFEPGSVPAGIDRGGWFNSPRRDFCVSDNPFYFSVNLPEGNYRVTVTLGDKAGESSTTVKAELRRLMLEKVETLRGQVISRAFVVNARRFATTAQLRMMIAVLHATIASRFEVLRKSLMPAAAARLHTSTVPSSLPHTFQTRVRHSVGEVPSQT